MTTPSPTFGPTAGPEHVESLLAHSDWIRRVARRLVGDAARAEDLVQESWLAALRRPPRHGENLRGWFATVVRHQAKREARSESRRAVREERAARPEASIEDVAELASTQRDLVSHVLALDEPFRSVVLLRFFEDRTPPEIAERLGVPLKTVHSRLARAFEKLRVRLDAEYGDSRRWHALLFPVVGRVEAPASATPLTSGSMFSPLLAVPGAVKLVLAAALLALLGWGLLRLDGGQPKSGGPEDVGAMVEAERGADEEEARLAGLDSGGDAGRTATAPAEPAAGPAAPLDSAGEERDLAFVRGQVIDLEGRSVPGLAVHADPAELADPVETASDGRFEIEVDRAQVGGNLDLGRTLWVEDPEWITILRSQVKGTNLELEHVIVVSRTRALEGRVQDSAGAPIEGARVALNIQPEGLRDVPVPLDMTRPEEQVVTSDGEGRFEMGRFPDARGLSLMVTAPGFQYARVELDEQAWPLVIELKRPAETGKTMLDGTVIDARGAAVEGADVQLGSSRTKSGPGGVFRLAIPHLAAGTPLCAAKAGLQPALVPSFAAVVEAADGMPEPVELVLGGPCLEIAGRVVDVEGAPCADWTVSITNETEISQFQIPIESAEDLAREDREAVKTGADGRFVIRGLMDRDYVVQAYDRKTLRRTEKEVRAGRGAVELRVESRLLERVPGQVVGRDGRPVADVTVKLSLATSVGSVGHTSIGGASTVTDGEGRFVLRNVPDRYAYLYLSGEAILNHNHRFEEGVPEEGLRIEVARRCHFQLELPAPYRGADRVTFEDADGQHLQVNRIEAGGMSAWSSVPLTDGKSMVLSVSELASTLVIERGGEELARIPVRLDPVGVTEIRP